jgi:hypothetical protein
LKINKLGTELACHRIEGALSRQPFRRPAAAKYHVRNHEIASDFNVVVYKNHVTHCFYKVTPYFRSRVSPLGRKRPIIAGFAIDTRRPTQGEVAEWSNAPDSKSGIPVSGIVGSNPTLSAKQETPDQGVLFFLGPPNRRGRYRDDVVLIAVKSLSTASACPLGSTTT